MDQRVRAPPHGFSQLATSFFACPRLGILRAPLLRLTSVHWKHSEEHFHLMHCPTSSTLRALLAANFFLRASPNVSTNMTRHRCLSWRSIIDMQSLAQSTHATDRSIALPLRAMIALSKPIFSIINPRRNCLPRLPVPEATISFAPSHSR
jgi:hypothetical protein